VFWGIRSRRPIPLPGANGTPPGGCQFGPDLSLVGLSLDLRRRPCPYWRVETQATAVRNLYLAQLALRRARGAAPSA
jgi:activating signal cointegrator complex subunit 1